MKKDVNHICPKCNLYISNSVEKHINSCDGRGPRRKVKRGKRGGWNKGINYEERFGKKWVDEYTSKLSKSGVESYKRGDRKPNLDENGRRDRISKKMKEVGGGYRVGSGRGKKGRYNGFWCDSSWELAWVIYHIDHKIEFSRNTESFDYIYLGETHKYYPDFIIGDKYYEIKGYMTEQTISKIESFSREIEVVDKDKIKPILKYVIDKYGVDFIKLYGEQSNLVVSGVC